MVPSPATGALERSTCAGAMHDGEKGHAGLMTPRNRTERAEAAADGASAKDISSIMSAQIEALATIKRLEAQVAALVQAGKQGAA